VDSFSSASVSSASNVSDSAEAMVGSSSTTISVKQYGHASYGSSESCCRFKALRGFVKVLPQETFGQVNVLLFLVFSSIWEIASPPVEDNYGLHVYSINEFKINIQTIQFGIDVLEKRAF